MAKAKRESKYVRQLKQEWANEQRQRTRKHKKEAFEAVMAKAKADTYADIYRIQFGLSRKAIEYAAYLRIYELVLLGYSPAQIVELMEPKQILKKKQADPTANENVTTASIDKAQSALAATTEAANQNS